MPMEMIPIAWNQNSVGVGVMTKAVPKVDGGQEDARVWELSFMVDLPSRQVVETMQMFPGADRYFTGATEKIATTTLKVKPLRGQMVHLDFVVEDEEGSDVVVLEDVAAEVRFVQLKMVTNVQVQTARVNLRGVPVDHSNAIVSMLEKRVRIKVRQDQQPLFAVAGDPDEPEEGQLVTGKSGGVSVVGIMRKRSKKQPVVDDFGVLHTLESHASTLWVESSDDAAVPEHLDRYAAAVQAMDENPTWDVLVAAIGIAWPQGDVTRPSGNTVYINAAVIDRAIATHAAGGHLPAEAGSGG